jgi:outer membrane immunogenic protein
MKKAVAIAACAALLGTPALAADMALKAPPSPTPVFSWTGFYVGLNAGYGWSNSSSINFSNGDTFAFGPSLANGTIPTNLVTNAGGFIGGAQAGYNFQSGRWVYGIETDFQYANIRGTTSVTVPSTNFFPSVATSAQEKVEWFGTLRPRVGFTVIPSLLFYATAGLAYGQVSSSTATTAVPTTVVGGSTCAAPFFNLDCGAGSSSQTRVGWTAGAGAEYALTPHWSIKAEYLYIDLGQRTYFVASQFAAGFAFPVGMQATATFHESIARAGINYRF